MITTASGIPDPGFFAPPGPYAWSLAPWWHVLLCCDLSLCAGSCVSQNREPEPLLLTVKATAAALSCSEQTITKMRSDGTLPTVRVGRSVRVPVDAIVTFISDQVARSATSDGA